MSRYDHCTTVNKVELNSREIIKVWPSETRPEELTIPKSCYITYMASTPDRTLRISVQNINLPCGQQAELTFYDSKHFETVLVSTKKWLLSLKIKKCVCVFVYYNWHRKAHK